MDSRKNTAASVWFITGCSRGIGLSIAQEALKAGRKVVATARNPQSLSHLAKQYPDRCLPLALDVNEQSQIRTAVSQALNWAGRIDVLVNNAGYGLQGAVEEVSMSQLRQQMETNFFGLVALTQAVLPGMREQRSGFIVNVSSIAGLKGMATLGAYNASKFAVNGISEALAQEVEPFGIRVSIVEPGPYRTDWAGSSLDRAKALEEEKDDSPYAAMNKRYKDFFDSKVGSQPGDPKQIAQVLLEAELADQVPLHMVFGDVAMASWQKKFEQLQDPQHMNFYPHDQYNFHD